MGKRAEKENDAIRLYAEGMEIPQIRVELDVSENTLRAWKSRAGNEWEEARTALRRGYVASFEDAGKRIRRAHEVAGVLATNSASQGKLGMHLNNVIQTILFEMTSKVQTDGVLDPEEMSATIEQMKGFATILHKTEQAAAINLKREAEIRKQAQADAIKAVDEVAASGRKGGLSDEAANEIRRKILGIGA